MFHINILRAGPPGSRLLCTLGGLTNSPIGSMPAGAVCLGFQDTIRMFLSSEHLRILKRAPSGTGLLETHFTLNLVTKTSKAGQDYNCNCCGYYGKGRQGLAKAPAHFSGEKGHDVAACPKLSENWKDKPRKEAGERLKQREQKRNKKRIFLSKQNPHKLAGRAPKKQAPLDSLQDKTASDVCFAEVLYHARVPFHISEDVMLRRYVCQGRSAAETRSRG